MKNDIKINIFISCIIVCIIIAIICLNIFSKKALPIFVDYTILRLENISTSIINNAVREEISKISNIDQMIIVTKNDNDEIQMVDFNPVIVNQVLSSITDNILSNLKEPTKFDVFSKDIYKNTDGIIYEVPIGVISSNVFLSNIGPKIPVKFNIIGDVLTNISTEIKEYGINNALVKISIDVSVNEKVIIPFISKTTNVSVSIPISLKMIQGNIPIYYGNGFMRNSNILSTPTE